MSQPHSGVPQPAFPPGPVGPPPRPRWGRRIGIAGLVVAGVLVLGCVALLLLPDDGPAAETDRAAAERISTPRADVERITRVRFDSADGDVTVTEPVGFRGADACRTAWEPLRPAVTGGAEVLDSEYDTTPTTRRQVRLGVVVYRDATAARAAVDKVDAAVGECRTMWVDDQGQRGDWKVQPTGGLWYLIPTPGGADDPYCAVGFRSEGRYAFRVSECGTGPNQVPALLDDLARRASAR